MRRRQGEWIQPVPAAAVVELNEVGQLPIVQPCDGGAVGGAATGVGLAIDGEGFAGHRPAHEGGGGPGGGHLQEQVVGETLVTGEVAFIPVAEPEVRQAIGIGVADGDGSGGRSGSGGDQGGLAKGAIAPSGQQGGALGAGLGRREVWLQVVEVAREDGVRPTVVIDVGEGQDVAGIELGQTGGGDLGKLAGRRIEEEHPGVVIGPTIGAGDEVGVAVLIEVNRDDSRSVEIGQSGGGGMVFKTRDERGGQTTEEQGYSRHGKRRAALDWLRDLWGLLRALGDKMAEEGKRGERER